MKKDIATKREKEIQLVSQMIALYCRKHHHENGLCQECQELEQYAKTRSQNCPFMETKTFCSQCQVHCYQPQMREKIKKVMRYSGARMIFSHPIAVISHMIEVKKERKKIGGSSR